ncbi:hypothetical protein FOA52_014002 [Chlamydomonas sp. UWO 241]|nr:hypothetical protein FOA52_014002 [Chlamydomonas sp. UWO 241]
MQTETSSRAILVPLDESNASKNVFKWTLENIVRDGDKLHLFHVVKPGQRYWVATGLMMDEVTDDDDVAVNLKNVEHAKQYLTTEFATKLEELKIPYQIEIVRFARDADSIGSVICKRADELNAVMTVMAKHTKGHLQEFFVGSVATYCTHNARTPVMVLHVD